MDSLSSVALPLCAEYKRSHCVRRWGWGKGYGGEGGCGGRHMGERVGVGEESRGWGWRREHRKHTSEHDQPMCVQLYSKIYAQMTYAMDIHQYIRGSIFSFSVYTVAGVSTET